MKILIAAALLFSTGCSASAAAAGTAAAATPSASASFSALPVFETRSLELLDTLDTVREQFPELTYASFMVNDIPVLEVTAADADPDTPLVIMMHGVTGNKEIMGYVLSRIASEGFRAISFDLPGHGERTDGAYMFLDVIEQAEKDLTSLLDYYTEQGYDTSHYGLGGFSAGGMVTYSYGMVGKYRPDIIIPVSSIADWEALQKSTLLDACYKHSQVIDAAKSHEEELSQLEADNPYPDLANLKNTKVIISHGILDTTFDWHLEEKTASDLEQLGNSNVSIFLSEEGHVFPTSFIPFMLNGLNKSLKQNQS